jgi:hypothetical protein
MPHPGEQLLRRHQELGSLWLPHPADRAQGLRGPLQGSGVNVIKLFPSLLTVLTQNKLECLYIGSFSGLFNV